MTAPCKRLHLPSSPSCLQTRCFYPGLTHSNSSSSSFLTFCRRAWGSVQKSALCTASYLTLTVSPAPALALRVRTHCLGKVSSYDSQGRTPSRWPQCRPWTALCGVIKSWVDHFLLSPPITDLLNKTSCIPACGAPDAASAVLATLKQRPPRHFQRWHWS